MPRRRTVTVHNPYHKPDKPLSVLPERYMAFLMTTLCTKAEELDLLHEIAITYTPQRSAIVALYQVDNANIAFSFSIASGVLAVKSIKTDIPEIPIASFQRLTSGAQKLAQLASEVADKMETSYVIKHPHSNEDDERELLTE